MVYFIFLIIGIFYISSFDYKKYTRGAELLYLFPFLFAWVVIAGGQDNVGTDYSAYLDMFTGDRPIDMYLKKGEYLYYSIVYLFHYVLGFNGQFFFYLFSFINVCLYISISNKVAGRSFMILFLLFITVSTLFHAQMNGLRQCTAVYLVTLAVIEMLQLNYKRFIVYIFLASGFHISSCIMLCFYFVRNIALKKTTILFLICGSAIVSFLSFDSIIFQVTSYIPQYSHYADSEYFEKGVSLLNKLTKLTTVPLMLMSVQILDKQILGKFEFRLYQIGMIAYFLKTICIVSSLTNRVGYFFMLLSVFPLFLYLRYLKGQNYRLYLMIVLYLIAIYSIKIILFPSGEYLYYSIYQEWI